MRFRLIKYLKYAIFLFFYLVACNSNPFVPDNGKPRNSAFGSVNHLVMVCDLNSWEGALGDSLRYYFESAYPILPQPEPIFDLRHMEYKDVIGIPTRRELRNYLFIADLSKTDSTSIDFLNKLIGTEKLKAHLEQSEYSNLLTRDVWAHGQQLMYLIGKNEADLLARLKRSFPGISKAIRDFDNTTIKAAAYSFGDAKLINKDLTTRYGIQIDIPADFKEASFKPQGTWLRKETDKASLNLIISKVKYKSTDQFKEKGIKELRDSISRHFIRTSSEGDYMQVNDIALPTFLYQKNVDGNYGVELRGVWETKIEYMGGPFQTYLFQTPDKTSLVYVDAFVYAPEMEKRNLIQHLETIVNTFRYPK
ncbi:MAG: DUF4837 family protein [Saprospiraceae bacterium]|nr:DUF4837 family protein [Saprospiraceae bacterium]